MSVDAATVSSWFDEYFDTFAACARGDRDMSVLLSQYGVPLIVTSGDGVIVLMTDDEAVAVMQSLVDGLRAQGYHHTDVLHPEVTVFNSTSALYRATLSRRDHNGAEVGCPTITYLVTEDPAGLRIAVLATHGE
jgi:hypothetical protein